MLEAIFWNEGAGSEVAAVAGMPPRGFTTVEAVVALSLLVMALASLGQVVFSATRATTRAAARSAAVMLAVDKLEQLRALKWTIDSGGEPVSDPALASSPADALERDVAGYADTTTAYVRRWAIRPLADSTDTLVLVVRVIARSGVEAQIATVRTRRAN